MKNYFLNCFFLLKNYFSYSVPSILRNSNRFRRDPRQLEEEEEIWFNEEDDFGDVSPTGKSEIDSLGEFLKIILSFFILDYISFKNRP